MKKLILFSVVALASVVTSLAQGYEISWFSIDGGGGTSSGGNYTISGTIGQPDAGTLTGGNYTLVGGFWGVVAAIQTEGCPLLTVERDGAEVVISWPIGTPCVLRETGNLASPNWVPVSAVPTVENGNNQVRITSPVGNKFYRLELP